MRVYCGTAVQGLSTYIYVLSPFEYHGQLKALNVGFEFMGKDYYDA